MHGTFVEMAGERAEIWIEGGYDRLCEVRSACSRLVVNAGWHQEAQGDLVLVVSELVTNACRHAQGPCRINLEVSRNAAVVEVWDSSASIPALPLSAADPSCEEAPACSGYGLGIVAALSLCVEILLHDVGGKTVRAVVVP